MERLAADKNYSLLGPFISYEVNGTLRIQSLITLGLNGIICLGNIHNKNKLQGLHSEHLIFFITHEWAQYARVFVLSTSSQPSVVTY